MPNIFSSSKFVSIFFFLSLTLISYKAITYSSSAPPVATTGGPSEGNCTSCHSGSVISSGTNWSNITLTTNIPSGGYTPGDTYAITFSLAQSSIVRYGFEATVLSSSNAMAGSFTAGTGSTILSSGSRTYIAHSSSGTSFTGGTASWTFSWTAPSIGVGNVTFYTTMNSANNNGSTSGDQIYTKSFTFGQINVGPPTAVITTIPNPATVCVGDTVYYSGSGINLPTGYVWSFGTGASPSTSTQQNQKVVYSFAGTISANLHTTNTYGTSPTTFKAITVLAKPSTLVTPSGNLSLCGSNDSIVLNAPVGAGLTYSWYPYGDISQAITVKNTGTYRVTVTNSNNCSATSANIIISQHGIPSVVLTASADSVCQNDSVTFTGSGNFISYRFLRDTSTIQNTIQKTFRTNLFSSSNVFTIIATDSFGCKSLSSNSKSVLVRLPIVAPLLTCGTPTSNSVQFVWNNVSGATGYNISTDTGKTWQTPSSGTTGLSHTITGLAGGTLTNLKVRTTTQGLCANGLAASQTCQTLGCPYVSFNYTGPKFSCLSSDTSSRAENISISNINAIKYSININNLGYAANASVPVNILKGTNNIHIKIIDSLNLACSVIDSIISVTGVNTPSTKPVLSFSNSGIDTTKQFCVNAVQTLFSNQPTGTNKYLFLRNVIDTIQSGALNYYSTIGSIKKFNNNDLATVIVMDTNYGCYKNSKPIKVVVNPLPRAGFTYVSTGKTIQFTDTSIGNIQNRNWNFGDNSAVSIIKNPLHSYASNGNYFVQLALLDSNGCNDSITKNINVTNTGISDISERNQFKVYPNPAGDQINISFELNQLTQIVISIFDVTGREVYHEIKDQTAIGIVDQSIQLNDFNQGIYLMKIEIGETQKLVKFIKQ